MSCLPGNKRNKRNKRNTQESSSQSATENPVENGQKEAGVADVGDVALFSTGDADTADAAYEFQERAAVLEFDGGYTRADADALVAEEMPDLPAFLDRRVAKG